MLDPIFQPIRSRGIVVEWGLFAIAGVALLLAGIFVFQLSSTEIGKWIGRSVVILGGILTVFGCFLGMSH